jgi:hypothetical protein
MVDQRHDIFAAGRQKGDDDIGQHGGDAARAQEDRVGVLRPSAEAEPPLPVVKLVPLGIIVI